MSEFRVQVVRLGAIEKHPNADTLGVTRVHDYPVIVRLGDYQPGDLAVYVPIDAIVPETEEWAFLGRHRRVGAKRLRGVFSMGLLTKAPAGAVEGDDVAEQLGITKWEPPIEAEERVHRGGGGPAPEAAPPPALHVPFYDIEGLRRWPDVLREGEEVVITEKIHGANARFVHDGKQLHVGSRGQFKKAELDKLWWPVARVWELERMLANTPGFAVYGEVYGRVQDLRYGLDEGVTLRVFDVWDAHVGCWLHFDEARKFAAMCGLEWVPVLYRGAWKPELRGLAEGPSTLPCAHHVREGIVIRPVLERWDPRIGRVQLKLHGEGFLTRKVAA